MNKIWYKIVYKSDYNKLKPNHLYTELIAFYLTWFVCKNMDYNFKSHI